VRSAEYHPGSVRDQCLRRREPKTAAAARDEVNPAVQPKINPAILPAIPHLGTALGGRSLRNAVFCDCPRGDPGEYPFEQIGWHR
jgi:hypothetical protein